MFVYFIYGGTCKRTTRVSIDLEKCVPRVGTYTEGSIDPALWYKVLAVDSILIDCDTKTASWSCEKYSVGSYRRRPEAVLETVKIRQFFEDKERLFSENVELSPTLTELFDTAETIFHNLSPEVFDREGNVPTYKNLLKILHVYILPRVKFEQKHQPVVQEAFHSIEKECENIEMLIQMNVQSKKNCEDNLFKQRRYLLSENGVSSILNNSYSDDVAIKLLLSHTEKDIRKQEDILSILTDKIAPLRSATDDKSIKLLADIRSERDKVVKEKEEIVLAREELVNDILQRQEVQSRKPKKSIRQRSKSKNETISEKLARYEKETTDLENLSNDIKQQINIKIRISSVREAASLTLREIETDGSSFGYNRKKGSLEIEADLFDPAKKPKDWMTRKEQVEAFLQTNHNDLRTKHEQFCTRVKENCKATIEKAKRDFLVNYGSLKAGSLSFTIGRTLSDHKESMRLSTRWLFGTVPKEDCEAICKQILDHITNMADEIAIEIQGDDRILQSFHTQVYICYEDHVSAELMPVLSRLYEQSFRSQCETLSNWIKEYSATELDCINKTIKIMFPDAVDSGIHNGHVQNSSVRIQRSTSFIGTLFGKYNETSGSWSESFGRTLNFLRRKGGTFSEPTPLTDQQKLNGQLMSAFGTFFTNIKEECNAVSIFSKLRHLTNAVQSAERKFSELRTENGNKGDLCTDDILDILILLICKLDQQSLLKLYAHVNLILHLSPYFLEGNINEYSLVSLTGAYQHLFERQEMHMENLKQWHQDDRREHRVNVA